MWLASQVVEEVPTHHRGGPSTAWRIVAGAEVALAAAVILLDLFLPTIVLLVLVGASLLYHRAGPASLGFRAIPRPARMAAQVLALVILWTMLQVGLVMPVLEHLTGQRQDMSPFDGLEGNLPMLVALLALSWTLAALGEETVYRGFLLTRAREVMGTGRAALLLAVGVSSLLFGLAHTEQGLVGVALTALDAVFFSVLRLHYGTLWAAVLAHGFNNTLGLTAFWIVGPIYGLW